MAINGHWNLMAINFPAVGAAAQDFFSTLGAPWEHLGGPWKQQDGFEGIRHRIFIDFEVTWGPYFESFLGTEAWSFNFCSGLFPGHFLHRFLNRNLDGWGFQIDVFAWSVLHTLTSHVSQNSFFIDVRPVFWTLWEKFFWFWVPWKQAWKLMDVRFN